MPLASRIQQAKKVLLRAYARTGGVPSVADFAKEMGYASTSSAFAITEALVEEGFLSKSPGGRLLPGPMFKQPSVLVPPEMLAMLPPGYACKVLRVSDASMVDAGVLEGDALVVAPELPDASGHLVVSKAGVLAIVTAPPKGWTVEGRLVAQFRSYL